MVVRGTDYLLPKDSKYLLSKYLPHGITPEETLEKAIRYVKEKNFDNVFLATEDAHILELFTQSELKDRLLYVDQKRMDYTKEENQDKLLMDVYQEDEGSDPYHRTLDYIAVLEGVSRCDALLANLTCGAVTYALCRKDSFEFVDVRKLEQAK